MYCMRAFPYGIPPSGLPSCPCLSSFLTFRPVFGHSLHLTPFSPTCHASLLLGNLPTPTLPYPEILPGKIRSDFGVEANPKLPPNQALLLYSAASPHSRPDKRHFGTLYLIPGGSRRRADHPPTPGGGGCATIRTSNLPRGGCCANVRTTNPPRGGGCAKSDHPHQ